MAGGIVYF